MSTHGHTASRNPAGGWSPARATDRGRRSSDAWGLAALSLLTSYRRDGRAVGTPVSLAVDGDHADLRSFEQAGKTRPLHPNPKVTLAPSTTLADQPARPSRPRPGAWTAPTPGTPPACWPPSTHGYTGSWCH